jgi:tetratricopeptide (TPR) repeat protein
MNGILRVVLLVLSLTNQASSANLSQEQVSAKLVQLDRIIAAKPGIALNYLERGDIYYLLNNLPLALKDYSTAISLDDTQDNAYFGRGMTHGRMGLVEEGIADLSVYIKRHPDSSVAYTKRGVRNIWRGNLLEAERDLTRAVELDPSNAEAHDDLGVVHAQQHRVSIAAKHFKTAIRLDPSYQKAYHNLAMCFYMGGKTEHALKVVDAGLELDADNRNSLLLKSTILQSLGREAEAMEIASHAEFLPESNWTERSAIGGISK